MRGMMRMGLSQLKLPFLVGLSLAWVSSKELGTISGYVSDPMGLPIANAKIRLSSHGRSLAETATDRDGKYHLADLVAGDFTLRISCDWCETTEVPLHLDPGANMKRTDAMVVEFPDLRLPTLHLRGLVLDADGKPIEDATVGVISPLRSDLAIKTTTDVTGRYNMEIRWLGQFVAYAFKPGLLIDSQTFVPSGPGTQPEIVFRLRPLAQHFRLD
jgi:hypothetical protein